MNVGISRSENINGISIKEINQLQWSKYSKAFSYAKFLKVISFLGQRIWVDENTHTESFHTVLDFTRIDFIFPVPLGSLIFGKLWAQKNKGLEIIINVPWVECTFFSHPTFTGAPWKLNSQNSQYTKKPDTVGRLSASLHHFRCRRRNYNLPRNEDVSLETRRPLEQWTVANRPCCLDVSPDSRTTQKPLYTINIVLQSLLPKPNILTQTRKPCLPHQNSRNIRKPGWLKISTIQDRKKQTSTSISRENAWLLRSCISCNNFATFLFTSAKRKHEMKLPESTIIFLYIYETNANNQNQRGLIKIRQCKEFPFTLETGTARGVKLTTVCLDIVLVVSVEQELVARRISSLESTPLLKDTETPSTDLPGWKMANAICLHFQPAFTNAAVSSTRNARLFQTPRTTHDALCAW